MTSSFLYFLTGQEVFLKPGWAWRLLVIYWKLDDPIGSSRRVLHMN